MTSNGNRRYEVIRWVSIPSRKMRNPWSRLSSQMGLFHVGGGPVSVSAPPMSLTRMSIGAEVVRIRWASAPDLCGHKMIDLDGDAF